MRTTLIPAALLALSALTAAACKPRDPESGPPAAPRAVILKDVPTVNRSILTDTAGSDDAERASYLVQVRFDSVLAFYRTGLPAGGWAIIGDRADTGMVDLYARKGAQTLWVHVEKVGMLATRYTLIANENADAPADSIH